MTALKPRKIEPHVCTRCGGRDIEVRHFADVLDFKGLTLEVEGLAETRCKACGYNWTTEGQEHDNLARIKEAYSAKRDDVREREGLLTGDEIRFVLSQLKLTKAEAATVFGGGPNAFSKYESGEVLQSFAMDRLLRVTLGFGTPAVEFLRLGRAAPLQPGAGYLFESAETAAASLVAAAPLTPVPVSIGSGQWVVVTSTPFGSPAPEPSFVVGAARQLTLPN